jgi:hypothetical protein
MSGKVLALFALIAFALGMAIEGDVIAGEKVSIRIYMYATKYEQLEAGDEKGHVVAIAEVVGIVDNTKIGESFLDGWAYHQSSFLDLNPESGEGSGYGYFQYIDKDGDKIFGRWEGKMVDGAWPRGKSTWFNGTGKFEGIKGSGTWFDHTVVTPTTSHVDFEGEMELP